jgi:hypothetical protein
MHAYAPNASAPNDDGGGNDADDDDDAVCIGGVGAGVGAAVGGCGAGAGVGVAVGVADVARCCDNDDDSCSRAGSCTPYMYDNCEASVEPVSTLAFEEFSGVMPVSTLEESGVVEEAPTVVAGGGDGGVLPSRMKARSCAVNARQLSASFSNANWSSRSASGRVLDDEDGEIGFVWTP